jgi:hypothetical protein
MMDDEPCNSFLQIDEEENFDVCYNCQYHRLDHKMVTMEKRNKNASKTKIDYDVNVYVREEYNPDTGQSHWNKNQWYLHVYHYTDNWAGDKFEVSAPYLLTAEESFAMNFLGMDDIDDGLDGWMDMDYLMQNYRDQMSDRILEYLESFPKYSEDIPTLTRYV